MTGRTYILSLSLSAGARISRLGVLGLIIIFLGVQPCSINGTTTCSKKSEVLAYGNEGYFHLMLS